MERDPRMDLVRAEHKRRHLENMEIATKAATKVDRMRISPAGVVLEFHGIKIDVRRDQKGELHIATIVPMRHFDALHQRVFLGIAQEAIDDLLEEVEEERRKLRFHADNG